MPYLKLTAPEIDVETKRAMARELTEAILRALNLSEENRYRTMIQFAPFKLDDMAIGGRLMADAHSPDYHLEVHERNLMPEKRAALVKELTPLIARFFKLKGEELYKVNIMFMEYKPEDFAVGGRFISELERH